MSKVIGVMSGTSLDGIDICLVEFANDTFKILNYSEIEYLQVTKNKISNAINQEVDLSQLVSLDYELGYEYSRAINIALDKWKVSIDDIELVANHGQTIYHNDCKPDTVNSTLQLGCGDIIKEQLNVNVVTNFRSADIAVGNKGAPIVQYFDQYLIEQLNLENCSFLNIGGIANIFINSINLSFDTGPGNMLIDYAVNILYKKPYDYNGVIAKSGKINQQLLSQLMDHEYFSNDAQLSTGREEFGDKFGHEILEQYNYLPPQDIVSTLTKFTADSISEEVSKRIKDEQGTIYVSGGGAYNPVLLEYLRNNFQKLKVLRIDDLGITANQKEAVAFAYFGYMNYNNLKIKTLNGKETILGVLHKRG